MYLMRLSLSLPRAAGRERFIEEVRSDEPVLASYLRIEERELEAGGGLNWPDGCHAGEPSALFGLVSGACACAASLCTGTQRARSDTRRLPAPTLLAPRTAEGLD